MKHHDPTQIPVEDIDPQACQRLWASVVFHIIKDALKPRSSHKGRDAADLVSARQWFTHPSKDTVMVLSMAGFDPTAVIERMCALINGPEEARRKVRASLFRGGRYGQKADP